MFSDSITSEFLTTYGAVLLLIAFAWSVILCICFACSWRKKRSHLKKLWTLGVTATFVGVAMYLPFIYLALAAKWGWV